MAFTSATFLFFVLISVFFYGLSSKLAYRKCILLAVSLIFLLSYASTTQLLLPLAIFVLSDMAPCCWRSAIPKVIFPV